MAVQDRRVVLERVDYSSLFSFVRVFRSFRMAIDPSRMLVALVMIFLIVIWGLFLDSLAGAQVIPGEFIQYCRSDSNDDFEKRREMVVDDWRKQMLGFMTTGVTAVDGTFRGGLGMSRSDAESIVLSDQSPDVIHQQVFAQFLEEVNRRQQKVPSFVGTEAQQKKARQLYVKQVSDWQRRSHAWLATWQPQGVFKQGMKHMLDVFTGLMEASARAVLGLETQAIGLSQVYPNRSPLDPRLRSLSERAAAKQPVRSLTLIGSLRLLSVDLPGWLWQHHTWFFALFIPMTLIFWMIFGGALSRKAVVEAATGQQISLSEALAYVRQRWFSYLFAPILPILVILFLGLLLACSGFVFFNWPVLDFIGALLFGVSLAAAAVMALITILWVPGVHLMYPCLSASGGEWYDASSRSLGYVWQRPWRTVVYYLAALVFGAATYILLGLLIFLTLAFAQRFVGLWVFAETMNGSPAFDSMLPPPMFDNLKYKPDLSDLTWSQQAASVVLTIWVYVPIGLLGAYAINYYFASTAHVFLLLRKRCDGTDWSQVYMEVAPSILFERSADHDDQQAGSAVEALQTSVNADKVEPTSAGPDAQAGMDESHESSAPES